MYITVKVNVYRLEKTWRVRSGQGTWTRPDPPGSGPDPTRPAALVNIPDPTRPNPTRPAGRPDPGTTLHIQIPEISHKTVNTHNSQREYGSCILFDVASHHSQLA